MRLLPMLLCLPALCLAPNGSGPVLTFDRPNHAFGKVSPDQKVSTRFKVSNTGHAVLQIKGLNPSCGCTSSVLGQWSLQPGESTEIEVGFNPAGFRGLVHKTLEVISNDPLNPIQTLSFEAEVVAEIMPSTTAVYFRDLTRKASRKSTVRLVSGNHQPVTILEAAAPGAPYLSTRVTADGLDALLEIEMDPRRIPARLYEGQDILTIRTASAKLPVLNLSVQWDMKRSIVATPDSVLRTEAAGKETRATVQLKHADGKHFRILSTKSSHAMLSLEGLDKAARAEHNLQVVIAAGAKPGRYNERIHLTLDDPDQPEFTLPVSVVLR